MTFKITYSVLEADLSEIHREFDSALQSVRGQLGKEFPYWSQGKAKTSGEFIDNRNPANTGELLSKFHKTPISELEGMFSAAQEGYHKWRLMPWQDRVKVIRRAADLISERRMELSAIMALETGKNRMESLGDVEESADLMRWNATQLEETDGFTRKMGNLSPNENTRDLLKPYGVFVVIAPFNFPLALPAGMTSAALLAGNSVIFKPSQDTPWCGQKLYELYRDAGMPDGVFQLVYGAGSQIGNALITHPQVGGVAFTGSYDIGMKIYREMAAGPYPRPCMLEMGGKNPAIICESAEMKKAVMGCFKSGFGLTGQKCSALSRIYVHSSRKEEFLSALVAKTKETVIGDPTEKDTFVGPLISESALNKHLAAIEDARKDGTILVGGEDIRKDSPYNLGHFAQPTIAELPKDHRLFRDELFSPFIAVTTFDKLEDAVKESNGVNLGLTGGIFSTNESEIQYFWDHMETGVLYANRETGATTGAWPGVNPFCGWKGSGGSGKGICGPYYVAQFTREQSRTLME